MAVGTRAALRSGEERSYRAAVAEAVIEVATATRGDAARELIDRCAEGDFDLAAAITASSHLSRMFSLVAVPQARYPRVSAPRLRSLLDALERYHAGLGSRDAVHTISAWDLLLRAAGVAHLDQLGATGAALLDAVAELVRSHDASPYAPALANLKLAARRLIDGGDELSTWGRATWWRAPGSLPFDADFECLCAGAWSGRVRVPAPGACLR